MAGLSRRDMMLAAAGTLVPGSARDGILWYCDANKGWVCNLT